MTAPHRLTHRLGQIMSFAATAQRPWDIWRLLVLGFARGHPLNSPDTLSQFLFRAYPTLIVRPRLLRGASIELNSADFTHASIFEEVFVEKVYDLSKVPFQPDWIIDCGAHIGSFTLLAATTFPQAKVASFEPNPQNAAFLKRQIDRNHLPVEAIFAAVSLTDGEAWFAAEFSCGGALQPSQQAAANTYQVKVMDFPKFVREKSPQRLLLKMDIEGEEQRLMPALVQDFPDTCAIFIETHQGLEGWNSMSALLQKAGFSTGLTRQRDKYIDGWATRP